MDLYFTRHGRTQWNKELRFQGASGDSPLLDHSLKEIALLGKAIENVPFQKIYASPQKRALRTAELINDQLKKPAEIITTADLKEMGLGKLEGEKIAEMQEKYPQELNALRRHPDLYNPKAFLGETFPEVLLRMEKIIFQALNERENDQPILFVGHGASLTAGIQHLAGKSLSDLRKMGGLNNNSLTILETKTGQLPFNLKVYNDVSFLKGDMENASGDELI